MITDKKDLVEIHKIIDKYDEKTIAKIEVLEARE
jgi:hypothetical protein